MGHFRVLSHSAHLQSHLLLLPSVHTVVHQGFFPLQYRQRWWGGSIQFSVWL